MARFTSVIEPLPLLATFPVVLSARVETPLGAIAAVTFMFPEFVPFNAPIRSVPADTRFSSAEVSDKWSEFSSPRLMTLSVVCGAIVTTPLAEVVPMAAERVRRSVVRETVLAAITFLSTVTDGLKIVTALEVEVTLERMFRSPVR